MKVNFNSTLKETQKKCLFLNTTNNLLSSSGVSYDTATRSCLTDHLSVFVGAILPDTSSGTGTNTGSGSTTPSSTTTPTARAIDGLVTMPYLILIFVSLLGYVLLM